MGVRHFYGAPLILFNYDGYLWIEKSGDYSESEKTELGIFTGLDIIGFIPVVGVVKYADEVADIVKAGSKVSDTRKAIEAVDNIKNLKNIEKGSEVIKDSVRSTDAVKAAKSKTDDIIRKVQSNEIELKTKKQKGNFGKMKLVIKEWVVLIAVFKVLTIKFIMALTVFMKMLHHLRNM